MSDLPKVFEYDAYRQYLRDWYKKRKTSRYAYSLQRFSEQAGFSSPNVLKQVMDGHRNLTDNSITKFAKALKLSDSEFVYFRSLVHFNQEKDETSRQEYFEVMKSLRQTYIHEPLNHDLNRVYDHWYHLVIRELIHQKSIETDYDWLFKRLGGRVDKEKIVESIKLLSELGLVTQIDGRWRQKDSAISSDKDQDPKTLIQYQSQNISIVHSLLKNLDYKNDQFLTDYSSLVLGIPKDMGPLVKEKIKNFRREILAMVSQAKTTDEVILVNVQMVPLTSDS